MSGDSLGIKLGGTNPLGIRTVGGGNRLAAGTSYNAISYATGENTTGVNDPTAFKFVNMPAVSLFGAIPGSFAIALFNSAANRFLDLEISALEEDGQGRVISSPRVVTADQTRAVIEQGTDIPYQTQGSQLTGPTISFRKAVLRLSVTPQITPEGSIILDLDVNKDSPGMPIGGANGNLVINTKHVQTQVLVENGGTVVIGGIFDLTETKSQSKIPLLGDIPILGRLFRQNTQQTQKDELLVFITPRMISDQGAVR
jgi:type IV pilus assembly protein PilQ